MAFCKRHTLWSSIHCTERHRCCQKADEIYETFLCLKGNLSRLIQFCQAIKAIWRFYNNYTQYHPTSKLTGFKIIDNTVKFQIICNIPIKFQIFKNENTSLFWTGIYNRPKQIYFYLILPSPFFCSYSPKEHHMRSFIYNLHKIKISCQNFVVIISPQTFTGFPPFHSSIMKYIRLPTVSQSQICPAC